MLTVDREQLKAHRIKWGFCPECGWNLGDPSVAYQHRDGICRLPDVDTVKLRTLANVIGVKIKER